MTGNLTNRDLEFHCEDVWLRVENRETAFTSACPEQIRLPIAHREGNYFADSETVERLEGEGRVVLRYVDEGGAATDAANPNGSVNSIAGIINSGGNVCGMMPHPERASESVLGGQDGRSVFESLSGALGVAP